MGNRLSKIYTRTGDDGSTGLGDGVRVPKEHLRVEAYGTVDEANSAVGVVLGDAGPAGASRRSVDRDPARPVRPRRRVVHPGASRDHGGIRRASRTTRSIGFNEDLPPLKDFILPGGGPAAAACHLARTVTRRAERRVWALARAEDVAPEVPQYLNRLSDLLFVIARVLARHENGSEVLWKRR